MTPPGGPHGGAGRVTRGGHGRGTDELGREPRERMYELMLTTKLADDRRARRPRAGRLQAAFYPVRGLEAVCAALGEVLRPDDQLVSTYRNLGDALAKGVPLRPVLPSSTASDRHLQGQGRRDAHHHPETGVMVTTGIVGTGLPIANGLASARNGRDDRVSSWSPSATARPPSAPSHEAMNLAALWKLPVIFLCQNNQCGEYTPIADYTGSTDLARRARGLRHEGRTGRRQRSSRRCAAARRRRGDPRRRGPDLRRGDDLPPHRAHRHRRLLSYVPGDELAAALARDPAPTSAPARRSGAAWTEDELAAIENAAPSRR